MAELSARTSRIITSSISSRARHDNQHFSAGGGMSNNDPWNRCDVCGRFIALDDFDNGAVRNLEYPDSEFTRESWETLCIKHAKPACTPTEGSTADSLGGSKPAARNIETGAAR
jgi:hypothetical protein